jgi:hypothetical protein
MNSLNKKIDILPSKNFQFPSQIKGNSVNGCDFFLNFIFCG